MKDRGLGPKAASLLEWVALAEFSIGVWVSKGAAWAWHY